MSALPSMWNLVISSIVFIAAIRYLRRYLDGLDIPRGMTRGVLVLTLATLASCTAGDAVDWAAARVGPQGEAVAPPPAQDLP